MDRLPNSPRPDAGGTTSGIPPVPLPRAEPDGALHEEQFRILVQSIRDYAILLLDTEGRIVSWNEGAERIKGYKAHEILGRSLEPCGPGSRATS
jgi:PAS domain-containing protein